MQRQEFESQAIREGDVSDLEDVKSELNTNIYRDRRCRIADKTTPLNRNSHEDLHDAMQDG